MSELVTIESPIKEFDGNTCNVVASHNPIKWKFLYGTKKYDTIELPALQYDYSLTVTGIDFNHGSVYLSSKDRLFKFELIDGVYVNQSIIDLSSIVGYVKDITFYQETIFLIDDNINKVVQITNSESPTIIRDFSITDNPSSLCVDDGYLFIGTDQGDVLQYDTTTFRQVSVISVATKEITGISFVEDAFYFSLESYQLIRWVKNGYYIKDSVFEGDIKKFDDVPQSLASNEGKLYAVYLNEIHPFEFSYDYLKSETPDYIDFDIIINGNKATTLSNQLVDSETTLYIGEIIKSYTEFRLPNSEHQYNRTLTVNIEYEAIRGGEILDSRALDELQVFRACRQIGSVYGNTMYDFINLGGGKKKLPTTLIDNYIVEGIPCYITSYFTGLKYEINSIASNGDVLRSESLQFGGEDFMNEVFDIAPYVDFTADKVEVIIWESRTVAHIYHTIDIKKNVVKPLVLLFENTLGAAEQIVFEGDQKIVTKTKTIGNYQDYQDDFSLKEATSHKTGFTNSRVLEIKTKTSKNNSFGIDGLLTTTNVYMLSLIHI